MRCLILNYYKISYSELLRVNVVDKAYANSIILRSFYDCHTAVCIKKKTQLDKLLLDKCIL